MRGRRRRRRARCRGRARHSREGAIREEDGSAHCLRYRVGSIYTSGLGLWRDADLICGLSTKGALLDMISMVQWTTQATSPLHDGDSSIGVLNSRWYGTKEARTSGMGAAAGLYERRPLSTRPGHRTNPGKAGRALSVATIHFHLLALVVFRYSNMWISQQQESMEFTTLANRTTS